MESGRFEEIESSGRCPGGQAEMSENPGDLIVMFYSGHSNPGLD